ncbi:MAG: hypothetical protein IKE76_14235 [Clostridia bacterium]|nr:hypothetical protein [Clostridia bacterium]
MAFIGIDLGTTNLKAALYDDDLAPLDSAGFPVEYLRQDGFVEFDADACFDALIDLLSDLLSRHHIDRLDAIALTGQAETLLLLDKDDRPVGNAISWMDERSQAECAELSRRFDAGTVEAVTGQLSMLPTWPATKLMWLRRHRPDAFNRARRFVLLKDYFGLRLTGRLVADMSIATFSLWFDIYQKTYWPEMLDALGIDEGRLAPLSEPCAVGGALRPALAGRMGIRPGTLINIGTLDHFSGMIGAGATRPGQLTLSTGTVMALATLSSEPAPRRSGIAMHYGFRPDTHVMLPVVESGGVSLEWFKRCCLPGVGYDALNVALARRGESGLLFLPNIVGTNAPAFDADATGVFWGLRQHHDAIDMAGAVMEGVSFVLRENCESLAASGAPVTEIIATGGGARSPVWCQLHADCTGVPVSIPVEKDAACLGAAIIAAVCAGRFDSFEAAASACVRMEHTYLPGDRRDEKYRRFQSLYRACLAVARG